MLSKILKGKFIQALLLLGLGAGIFSFSRESGGEGFEIYLDSHLLLRQYGEEMNQLKSVALDPSSSKGQLSIKYWHCGRAARDRVISIKDDQNHLLKEWHFPNESETLSSMSCNVKDILGLKKGNVSSLKLYYTSSQLPAGRMLASLVVGSANSTSP